MTLKLDHIVRGLWLVALSVCLSGFVVPCGVAQGNWYPGYPGQSIRWQRAQAPFTPGGNAVVGGPGSAPQPGTPMYVCRAWDQGSLVPGKWVGGNCNVAYGNREDVMSSYEVAYGRAQWGSYQGSTAGLAQTGHEQNGQPLYSCRVHYTTNYPYTDYGYQPGKLVADGTCHIPFGGGEVVVNAPFDVLYANGGGYPPNYPPNYPPYPPYPPYTPPAPLPPCLITDPGVMLNGDGLWAGPNCTPSDGRGHVPGAPNPNQPPPGPYTPGPSSVSWQTVQSPFVPGQGAVMGGPGNGPKPGAPLYVCRAYYSGGLYPGKWIEGQCSIADEAGKEQKVDSYDVANGNAEWRNFDGNVSALVPGGYDVNGTPLYICRKKLNFFGDKGFQPGRLEGSQCIISYGGAGPASGPPFEALYNVFSSAATTSAPPASQPAQEAPVAGAPGPDQSAPQPQRILVIFTNGTGATAGAASVTNGETGKTVTKALPANSSPQQCVLVLQQAAFEAGLQIQAQTDGKGLRVFGVNNAVHVTQASIAVTQY